MTPCTAMNNKIKRLSQKLQSNASFWDTWKKMKAVSKGITQADIDDAVAWARKNPVSKQ
jgi:hypothetical protein